MSTDTITLRNTINGVPATFEASYAKRLLADPHYGKILVEVDSEKPEVLSQPRIDGVPIAQAEEPEDEDYEPGIERGYDETAFGDDETLDDFAPAITDKD